MKRFLIPAILLVLLLGACQGNAPATTEAAPLATIENYSSTQPSGESSVPATQPAPAGTQVTGTAAGCTVVSPQPTPGPTEQSLFPPVSDQDWVIGPETASITIIEYGDFQ